MRNLDLKNILENKRADYGKQIVSRLATQLSEKYGRSFELRNLRRMMQFAEQFSDFGIVSPSATQLSWAHIVEVMPLKTQDARLFYYDHRFQNPRGYDADKTEVRQRDSSCCSLLRAPEPSLFGFNNYLLRNRLDR